MHTKKKKGNDEENKWYECIYVCMDEYIVYMQIYFCLNEVCKYTFVCMYVYMYVYIYL